MLPQINNLLRNIQNSRIAECIKGLVTVHEGQRLEDKIHLPPKSIMGALPPALFLPSQGYASHSTSK